MAVLKDKHNTGRNGIATFSENVWMVQSFTPLTNYTVKFVKLEWWRTGLPGIITVSIKATDVDGKPTGADLCSGTTDGDTLTESSAGEWRQIDFTTFPELVIGTKYAIVCRAPDGTYDSVVVNWWLDANAGYANGERLYSTDSGSSWVTDSTRDMMFEVWGGVGGFIWIEGTEFHYIDENGDERYIEGTIV